MGLIQNLKDALRGRSREELERAYLDGATSVVDLELRQREIDRGKFRRRSTEFGY
jgi:hypothetical protein